MEASHPLTSGASASAAAYHPLVLAAAASVTVLSLAGTAYFAGWMPRPAVNAPALTQPATVASPTIPLPVPPGQAGTAPRAPARAAQKPTQTGQVGARHVPATGIVGSPRPDSSPFTLSEAPTRVFAPPPPPICRDCGVVESVREVPVEAKGSGGGAIAGGIVGGVIGNQIGHGTTRDIATVLGAVGGAFAGNHLEKSAKESKRYDVTVRFEDGSTRTFSSDTPPAWHGGERVQLQNGTLTGRGRPATDLGTT